MRRRWLLVVSLVCCVVLFVFVTSRDEDEVGVQTLNAPPPARHEVATSSPPQVTGMSPPRTSRTPPETAKPDVSARSEAPVEENEGFRLPPGTVLKSGTSETPWDLIAIGGLRDHFKFEEARQLVDGLTPQTHPGFRRCSARFVPPPEIAELGWYEGMVVLDIESSDEGYEVVDASITDGSFGDTSLESCIREVYKGVSMPASNIEVGRRYRLEWPVTFRFGAKEEMPEGHQKEG